MHAQKRDQNNYEGDGDGENGEGPESWGGGVNLRKNHRKNWNAQTPSANAPNVNFKSFGLAVLAVKIAKVDFQICRYKMAE